MQKEKNLELERLVFFSDAVVAIAITLLALDLRIETPGIKVLTFQQMLKLWPKFSAFLLSFLLIAVFWKIHHQFFVFIKNINSRLLWYNIAWLFCIIILPFSTTLISNYSRQPVSAFIYALNTLCITIFQNAIWDYAVLQPGYLKENTSREIIDNYRFDCNVAMVNGLLATALSFITPSIALGILFIRPLMIRGAKVMFRPKKMKQAIGNRQ